MIGVDAVTTLVTIENAAVVAPCGTIAVAGTAAAAPLLDSATDTPPAGAAAVNVTVPCDDDPPVTLAGLTEIEDSVGAGGGGESGLAVSVTVPCVVVPFHSAVSVAVVVAATAVVGSENDIETLPALMNTDAGGVADAESLDSATTAPPGGAWPVNTTIAVAVALPVSVDGEI